MIPGDPQIRAQIKTTHFQVNSVVDSGILPETAPKGNRIVTLNAQICVKGGSWFCLGRLRWSSSAYQFP